MKLRDEAKQLKKKMLNEEQIINLFSDNSSHHGPTLRFLINQVIYKVDDSMAQYFVPKFIEKLQKIDERDYTHKLSLKKDVMLESLILLKITKIGIDEYKINFEEISRLLTKEIEENLVILNDLKTQEQEVLDSLMEEEKFLIFLTGIKALYQIFSNMHESSEILDLVDTKYAMDIEVYCEEIRQGLEKIKKILKILDKDLGISENLMKPITMKDKILSNEVAIEEGFTAIQRDKYNNMCSLCATYISHGEDKNKQSDELHLPERRLVFNNQKEEQQTYHNY